MQLHFFNVLLYAVSVSLLLSHICEGQTTNSTVPVSRKYLRLDWSFDSKLHILVPVDTSVPNNKNYGIPIILDTGSPDLMLVHRSFCDNTKYSTLYPTTVSRMKCYENSSISFVPSGDTTWSFVADGQVLLATNAFKGIENISMTYYLDGTSWTEEYASGIEIIATPSISAADSQGRVSSTFYSSGIHPFYLFYGVLGVSYSTVPYSRTNNSPFSVLLGTDMDNPDRRVFSLDVNHLSNDSRMWIGGVHQRYQSSLQVTDALASSNNIVPFHSFYIYDLALCGSTISKGPLIARIDTGSACLGLARSLFDSLTSYAPIINITDAYSIRLGADLSALPTVSFRMKDGGSPLLIRLTDLLYVDSRYASRPNRICITRLDRDVSQSSISAPAVVLGSRTLSSLYAAFMMDSRRVGLANKPSVKESVLQCKQSFRCKGMQSKLDRINACSDAPCADYFFFALDDNTKDCVLTSAFHYFAIVIIGVFFAVEWGLSEWENHMIDSIRKGQPLQSELAE